ncbi:hypothetical protein BIW11_00301 [Tropilaelaps mercedesae]|uniref:Uncharacterized protein n=1 Tax=Tropilaelaps mercedesae TaxID=418985 RepID=A0A1V9XYA9_9ACAR|nr:hypothetical protein BIW11_00301 [Tropilaelaps mercedesae]
MKEFARAEPSQFDLDLQFKPLSAKCGGTKLRMTMHSNFLREGKATDEDMQSVASLMSLPGPLDVANLDDFDELPSPPGSKTSGLPGTTAQDVQEVQLRISELTGRLSKLTEHPDAKTSNLARKRTSKDGTDEGTH